MPKERSTARKQQLLDIQQLSTEGKHIGKLSAASLITTSNEVDVLHVRLTELDAAHQNLPCYLLTY